MRRRRFGSSSNSQSDSAVAGDGDDLENPLLRPGVEIGPDDSDEPRSDRNQLAKVSAEATSNHHDQQEDGHADNSAGCEIADVTSNHRVDSRGDDDWTSQHLPSEIRCPVCLDAFTSPVTLHCNHNVCKRHILDLAAMVSPQAVTGPSIDLRVPCPKCRKETIFENAGPGGGGEAAISVNHEMQAIVDMMIKMLQQQQQPQMTTRDSADGTRRPGSATSLPPLGRRNSSRERRQVSFKSDDGQEDRREPSSSSPAANRGGSESSESSSPPQGGTEQRAITKLVQLEKELQRRRDEQRLERERIAKQKADEYKRQRQSWIDEKNKELLQQEAWATAGGQSEADSVLPLEVSPLRPTSSRMEALERAQQIEHVQFAQERRHEVEVHKHVHEFLKHNDSADHWSKDDNREAWDSSSPNRNRFGNNHQVSLSSSAKAREAESRVMHAYRAPTEEEYRAKREAERRQRELEEEEARRNAAYVDEEVEKKLWDVEMLVRREHEAELTRAQMAEIAELRARQTLAKFAKSPPQGTPPKPAYVPKLNRLQKF